MFMQSSSFCYTLFLQVFVWWDVRIHVVVSKYIFKLVVQFQRTFPFWSIVAYDFYVAYAFFGGPFHFCTAYNMHSGVFREGHGVMAPPLWPDHENFLQANLYEKMRFLPFSSKNCKIQQCLMVFCVSEFQKNGRICGFHWTFRSKKCGLRSPDSPTRGSAPGPRWGLRPQAPVIGSRSARSPWPPFAKS